MVVNISSSSAWKGSDQERGRQRARRTKLMSPRPRTVRYVPCGACQRKTKQIFRKDKMTLECQTCRRVVITPVDPALSMLRNTE
jgi:ribosomal protein S27E